MAANSSTPTTGPTRLPSLSPSLPSGPLSAPPTSHSSPTDALPSSSSSSASPVGPPASSGSATPPPPPPPPTSASSASSSSSSSSSSSQSSGSTSDSASGSATSGSSTSSSSQSTSSSSASSATPTTLSQTSTSVFASTAVMTSDGQVVTSVVQVTTIINPGTVITPTSLSDNTRTHSSSNVGAIVGGVVGGIAGLLIVLAVIWALLRKKRIKDEFDGNFDPAYVSSTANGKSGPSGGAALGGTLPNIPLDEEDDGMGGRLAAGAEGGGIISPYSYQPPSTTHSGQALMSQVPSSSGHGPNPALLAGLGGAAAGAAAGGYLNEKRRSYPGQGPVPGEYNPYHAPGPSNASASITSGSHYPASLSGHGHAPLSPEGANANLPPVTPSDASYPHTATTGTGSSGYYPNSVNPYAPPIGRGPSPGPSAIGSGGSEHSSSGVGPYSGFSGGSVAGGAMGGVYNPRSQKEMEARGGGMRLANPDDPQRQAYLQYGPGGIAVPQQGGSSSPPPGQPFFGYPQPQQMHQPGQPSFGGSSAEGSAIPPNLHPGSGSFSAASHTSSGAAGPSRPPAEPRAGSAVIVHQDGGRVVLSKGGREGIEEGEEEGPSEIPPTYDSLPNARPAGE